MNKTNSKQDATSETDTKRPKAVKKTSLELPDYVWEAAREYLNDKPDMRFRNMVMAGFRALGLNIDDEDLVAERKRGPTG